MRPNKLRCQFCGVRGDLDFHTQLPTQNLQRETSRTCPDCHVTLQPIKMQASDTLRMYRCGDCYGMHFDRGELQRALGDPLFRASEINLELIENINIDRYRGHKNKIRYRQCPKCQRPMNRRVFSYRSGVTVDICHQHGIWLDNGELIHLLEWSKAGGQKKAIQREQELARQEAEKMRGGFGQERVDENFYVALNLNELTEHLPREVVGDLMAMVKKLL